MQSRTNSPCGADGPRSNGDASVSQAVDTNAQVPFVGQRRPRASHLCYPEQFTTLTCRQHVLSCSENCATRRSAALPAINERDQRAALRARCERNTTAACMLAQAIFLPQGLARQATLKCRQLTVGLTYAPPLRVLLHHSCQNELFCGKQCSTSTTLEKTSNSPTADQLMQWTAACTLPRKPLESSLLALGLSVTS